LITPSARAILLAAGAAVPAFAIAVALPAYWYAGLIAVVFVLALTIVDALALVPAPLMPVSVHGPHSASVGQSITLEVVTGAVARAEVRLEPDARLIADPAPAALRRGRQSFAFDAVRRGISPVGAVWLRWAGPFGMVWRQRRVAIDHDIAIVPDIRPVRAEAMRLFRRDLPAGETIQLDKGAGAEFQALAAFRPGMDHRAIDWKHSARHGALIVREFQIERNNDIVFAIDGGRLMCDPVGGLPKVDRAVTAALTAAFVALKLGDKISLFAFDSRPRITSGTVSGAASFGMFQQLAAKIDYSAEETNFTLALTTLGARLVRRSLLLIFTDFADPTSAELMLRSIGRLAERHLILFVLMRDVELDDMAGAAPAVIADVSRTIIAASLLRERRIVIARLQRLGVHVIEAPHEQLGTALINGYLDLKRRDLL
jgi:uncharacterized protein (DUF58 family)